MHKNESLHLLNLCQALTFPETFISLWQVKGFQCRTTDIRMINGEKIEKNITRAVLKNLEQRKVDEINIKALETVEI